MWSVFLKEINSFFSSLIGYIVIGLFLIVMGLFMFIFPETSLLSSSFASLDQLFGIAPNIFIFLIPAITMRSFAEEKQLGTYELLATRPIPELSIIMGKFLASLTLVLFALLPTLLYYYTIESLGANPEFGTLDSGAIMGSYFGMIFLAMTFVSIGLFASTLTNNQIVAFLSASLLCFWFYFGFDFMSQIPVFIGNLDSTIQNLGMRAHYDSISRGIIDSRDVIYYLTVTALFILLTKLSLDRRNW